MKRVLHSTLAVLAAALIVTSCVDDYQDANPPLAKDGPFFKLSAGGDVLETEEDGNFLGANSNLVLTLSVISCEGLIDSVGVVVSDTFGIATVDQASLNAVRGQKSGEIQVIFASPDEVDEEVDITLDVTLYDGQEELEWNGGVVEYRKSSTESYDVTLVACTSTGLAGTYTTLASGFFGEGGGVQGDAYTDLASEITITEIRPGQYRINDMSFGLYPVGYGDVSPVGDVNLCGNEISDRGGTDRYGDPFTINGTLNADGTLSIQWNNTWGDTGTVTCTPVM
jgi:hypothetical protein